MYYFPYFPDITTVQPEAIKICCIMSNSRFSRIILSVQSCTVRKETNVLFLRGKPENLIKIQSKPVQGFTVCLQTPEVPLK